jgi:ribonuclease HI
MVEQPPRVIAAACDGACSGNPGPGGWGALLRFEDGTLRELGGSDPATTNNRMELCAALALMEALRALPRHPELVIRTDSRYLIDGLQKWLPGWKRKGWRTASGGPVLNRDLWEQLERQRLPDVPLVHVRGHSGDRDNDRCDAIAVAFSRGQRPRLVAASPATASGGDSAGPAVGSGRGARGTAATPGLIPADGLGDREGGGGAEPDQNRCGSPQLREPEPAAAAAAGVGERGDIDADPAPEPLRQLLGRLELADRLARGGYALTLVELAQLVELPVRLLEERREVWLWRDWRVLPQGSGRWRLERDAGGLTDRQ